MSVRTCADGGDHDILIISKYDRIEYSIERESKAIVAWMEFSNLPQPQDSVEILDSETPIWNPINQHFNS